MILVVGLGNPSKKFEKTRHNLGFRVLDFFQKEFGNFSDWRDEKKFRAEVSCEKVNQEKIILAKPQTFMNNSGKAVKSLIGNWKLEIGNLFVVHDDLDLPLGKIKISIGRSSAGHKGVKSIIKEIGTPAGKPSASYGAGKNFIRFRIGIQPKTGKPKDVGRFVLQKFNKGEEKIVRKVIQQVCQAIEFALTDGVEKAMTKFN